jgi:hypothetical protein
MLLIKYEEKQNTIGLANPAKQGERKDRPCRVREALRSGAEREPELRNNSFPFDPSLVAPQNWQGPLKIHTVSH